MIVDTSALMAIVFREIDVMRYAEALECGPVSISAPTLLEAEMVVHRRKGPRALDELQQLMKEVDANVIPFDEHHARIASDAHRRYGRGSKHPANLNFGDCFSYALAIARDEPLLFKGDDFIHTDVRVAAR